MEKSLTTGDIADYCQVNLRTVIRWINAGKIKGYKLPGRGNNRVLVSDFLTFLNQHHMPIPKELQNKAVPSILIVDDETSYATAIERVLKRQQYQCTIANSGFAAGVILNSQKPTLMTLDLSMPGTNGFDVIALVRSEEALRDTKILVVSALSDEKLAQAKKAGANDTLAKPFTNEELVAKVSSLLNA
ncbi:response regulator [Thalassotalea sp. PLHSN55]|uniref:response regulator n=1 Tax=Thalassotalea sp. PLHSN55 TaxID=3435888 RepID=UPI003F83DE85